MVPNVLGTDFTQVFLLDKTVDDDEEWHTIKYAKNHNENDPE